MIIAIDGYEANVQQRVGIGRYAYELVQAIYAVAQRDSDHSLQFRIYLPQSPREDMPEETSWWKYCVRTPAKFWTFVGLPIALLLDSPKADVVFSPTHYVPRFTGIPRVMSIMDLSYLYFPEYFTSRDLYQLTQWTKYSVLHSRAVCTISEFSKNDIIRRYSVNAARVHVTYPGFSMNISDSSALQTDIVKKYGIQKHYILSVGTIQPRKNYERLIEAFSIFLSKNKQKFGNIDLVIIGKKGWLVESILHAPQKYHVSERVKFLDFVTDGDLPAFYTQALCFALPSLYEGFGLPVVEAMAYKCPVVVSNVSSLPEIAGEAGIYVDPKNVESIADGMLAAVRQRNLKQGAERIQKGQLQVKGFTWEKAAKQTIEILTSVGTKK